MVKGPPFHLQEKKKTIKEEYQDKIDKLNLIIRNGIKSFEKDSGCKVTGIASDNTFEVLSVFIETDITGD